MLIHSMEFNVFEHFKDFRPTTGGPVTPEAQATSFFLGGPMGRRIREHAEPYARKAGVSMFFIGGPDSARRLRHGAQSRLRVSMHAVIPERPSVPGYSL